MVPRVESPAKGVGFHVDVHVMISPVVLLSLTSNVLDGLFLKTNPLRLLDG